MEPERFQELALAIEGELAKLIVGQRELVRSVLIALIAGGHVLLEGQPGWARRCWCGPWAGRSTSNSRASSSRPTLCRPT